MENIHLGQNYTISVSSPNVDAEMPPSNSLESACPAPRGGALEDARPLQWMDPFTIKFSQATISCVFARKLLQSRNAREPSRHAVPTYSAALKAAPVFSLHETLQQLKDKSLTVEQIPPIRVCQHDGKLYTLDNRRLWVFRQFGQLIPVLLLPNEEGLKEFHRKFDSRETDGETVTFLDSRDKQAEGGRENESFLSIVLQWSVEDVMNERMYVNKIEQIPERFSSLQTYYRAFQSPLLEDTRGQVQHSLEAVGLAPYMSLRSVEELDTSNRNKSRLRKLKLTTHVAKNCVERSNKEAPWKPKPTDLLVLSTVVPESVEDLRRSGEHYTLAEIHSALDGEDSDGDPDDSPLTFKVTAYAPSESPEYLEILDGKRSWYAVFLGNLATGMRIWEALNPGAPLVEDARQLVQETLYSENSQGRTSSEASEGGHQVEEDLESVVERYCNFRHLNESQTEAVRCTVMGLLNEEGFRARLIQGPPGTGKTSTITALVSIISSLKERILVCAPTNRAVSEVAERFLQHLQSSLCGDIPQFCEFTTPLSIGMRFCRPLQIGDVVMVANEDKVDTNGVLGKIFLPHRIKRLQAALAPHSGWRHTAQLVVRFLGDALDDFALYEQLWKENKAEETPLLDFLQFIRKRLNLLVPSMIMNGQIMCSDLPSKLLSPVARKVIEDSCALLKRLLKSLTNESLTNAEVRRCFTSACLNKGKENSCIPCNDFCSVKDRVLELMSSQPGYYVKGYYGAAFTAVVIEELCLRNASLVFSTTASAGRRCVLISGPFDYAVIDEAAQLVEAETAIVTQLPGVNRALLVGDPRQLQALVTSQVAKDCGYGRSLFERLQTLGHPCHVLNVQYRMHPAISQFPNVRFYNGAVSDGPNVLSGQYEKPCQIFYGPYAFIDVIDGEEERDENSTSWRNPVEAEVVQHLITKIRADESQSLDVGIIAPYKSQVDLVMKRQQSPSAIKPPGASTRSGNVHVDVKTVDGFQGGEKDVIIFSAVRANAGGHIGFVEDGRRLNVALTRGRYCVWIVGNASTLAAHDEMWRALIEDAKRRCCYRDATDDQGLRKIILRVKKELEQFASLLHHNSVLFKDTLWQVKFSKEFKDTIIKMKSTQNRQTILNTILHLANGRRSPYPTKCVSAAETYSKMIHVQPIAGLTLVWTIDLEKSCPVKQVIKIWDAIQSSHISGFIRRLEAGFSTYTAPYIDRCSTVKFQTRMSKVVVPAVWKSDPTFRWHPRLEIGRRNIAGVLLQENDPRNVNSQLEKSTIDESILLMKFYSLTSGIARQLLTAVDGSTMELLFEVNEEEAAIIQYPFTTFILGRSGTGKTTVITTRLLKIEQFVRLPGNGLSHIYGGEFCASTREGEPSLANNMLSQSMGKDFLRQAVITLSPKLCAAIKHHIAKASRTMLAEDCETQRDNVDENEDVMLDEEEEEKLMGGIPDTLVNISGNVFPLVITFRKFLAMIDGSLSCPFLVQKGRQLHSSLNNETVGCEGSECSSLDAEEATDEREDEDKEGTAEDPNSYDIDGEDSENFSVDEDLVAEEEDRMGGISSSKQLDDHRNSTRTVTEVTFERFISCYWPHFNQNITKHFDSSIVFTEIISFIKGSWEALHTENGRLTRPQYVSMASKRSSNFDEQQRDFIYSLFVLYERHKSIRREYDIADYCMHLYGQMRLGEYKGLKFHYVYVDEVQDLTMAQIALFKYVCLNMEQGYVFAGDTAQTIARGVSFRFEDIRHLFYTEFLEKGENLVERRHRMGQRSLRCDVDKEFDRIQESCSSDGKASSSRGMQSISHMPDLHHLSQNFRTHVGILKIANSIVQLLHHFFPNAVDKLEPESSLILGDTPIFLEREENNEFVTGLFGHGGAAGGGGCDFGAEQVILVRDMETKHHMIEKLGKRGLVMSVLECKGLEFQDVLLYNFFTDSLLEHKWRVIYSYMAENSKEDQNGRQWSFPQFDVQKHNLLMSELKQLYVVVTRARQRLWIYDECPAHHKPMLDFWNYSGLIQVKRLDEELIKTIHGKSTPDDWRRRGKQMFNDHHYDMAQLSFERAGDMHLANWAKAAGLQQAGERLLGSDVQTGGHLFREAATLFLSLGKGEAAAKCHLKVGDNRKAGMIFRDSCRPPRLEEAGDCFIEAKCWEDAAQAYNRGLCVRQCLAACFRGKLLDVGLNYLVEWDLNRKNPDCDDGKRATSWGTTLHQPGDGDEYETLKVDYLKKCAHYYHKERNTEKMMKFVRCFPSINSRKLFLERRDYFDQVMEVEEGEGNFMKAAEMAELKGDLKHAASLLERGGCHELAVEKILEHVRFDMLWSGGKQGWPLISTPESEDLLQKARGIVSACSHAIHSDLQQELELLSAPGCGLEHWNKLRDSKNIRIKVIAGRQAIDEGLLQSTALLASLPASDRSYSALVSHLLSIWDNCSSILISLIQTIHRAQRNRDTGLQDESFLDCSNTYLGAKKHTQPHLFLVADADMSWLKNSHVTRLPNQGRRCHVTSGQLFSSAEAFWATQLWQAGLGIVKMLECILFTNAEQSVQKLHATSFSGDAFQTKGELLCKLYSITEAMVNILSQNAAQEGCLELRPRLLRYGQVMYEASFPFTLKKESLDYMLTFRQEVGTIYDTIATTFTYKLQPVLDITLDEVKVETVAKLQILLPLLSRQWIRKHGPKIQERMSGGKRWSTMWHISNCFYGSMSEGYGQLPGNTCDHWLKEIGEYCHLLWHVYNDLWKSVGPFMFLQMLERAIVMDLACHTHLHGLLLPESLVVNHMTGNNNAELFSAILNASCTKGHRQFSKTRVLLRLMLDILNSSNYQVEQWFDQSKIDWRVFLPSFIYRLVVSVLAVCINTFDYDRQISDSTVNVLGPVFQNGSPLLSGLPKKFMTELRQVLSVARDDQLRLANRRDDQLRFAYRKAMDRVEDPLIVLKHGGKKIAAWAHKMKLRVMVISRKHENRMVFATTYSAKKKLIWTSKSSNGPDLQGPESEDLNGFIDARRSTEDNTALETVGALLRTGQSLGRNDYDDEQEEFLVDKDDKSQDAWIAAESTDDTSLASQSPPGLVSIGEGQTVPLFIRSRLLQRLEEVRERLKEELSATERYQRAARTFFREQNIQGKVYLEVFLAEACPLKASTDEWLQTLEASVQALKYNAHEDTVDDSILDEMADSQDALQKAAVILNPRNEEHALEDLSRLQGKLAEVKLLLETGKQKFKAKVLNLEKTCIVSQQHDGNVSNNQALREAKTSSNQASGGNNAKKKKPAKKKKKGKR